MLRGVPCSYLEAHGFDLGTVTAMLTGLPSSYSEAHGFDLGTVTAYANRGTFFVFGSSRFRSGYCDCLCCQGFRGLYDFLDASDDLVGIIKPFHISFSSPFHQ
jgi:hypothetical protein